MTDLLIVGGGIMGLWAAVMADRAGIETMLVERSAIGAGASGGILGALMPHVPDRWNEKKQFQFDALVSLEAEIRKLEAETGLSAGYRRSGRIIPLAKPHLRTIALRHQQEALEHWRSHDRPFFWNFSDISDTPGWPDRAVTENGMVFDTLAARVAPRALLDMLTAVLRGSTHVTILEGTEVVRLDPTDGKAELQGGQKIDFGHCILAAGVQSFPLIDALHPAAPSASGTAVKGQAALLKTDIDPSWPVIYSDGLYLVPHEDGRVAVGSTSEISFADPLACDRQLDDLLERAYGVVPMLRKAEVLQRWAGLRPKAIGREPMVGRHPDFHKLLTLTGGFKVSFGLAHRLAASVIADINGQESIDLPESFRCREHVTLLKTGGVPNRKGPATG
ncbi:NAD(P)/FAD-dependent oxidoreductase [Pararhizobium antarcticum]|uniref:D-amino-acid oxidase n=1 Tax=Pararhizobium antarcticum TaxID=1798805 RepID=A0A657LT58_9HYPH|nr:FAD-dependent oxidoreductase [Pararhizobium antarcticum]OJF95541.1 D-amino-acid oxidase [Rhizobium sp. 58]OJF96890.1 D-amino-acid oxidase [Pararhizobium antarcticum]